MKRTVVHTDKAPAAIGPYSQAITAQAAQMVFCSGQIALVPGSTALVTQSVEAETKQVMENLKHVLEEAGASLDSVVRCTIYLTDLGDFAKVNEVYGSFFSGAPPARVTVGVASLPKGVRVEIDAIALVG